MKRQLTVVFTLFFIFTVPLFHHSQLLYGQQQDVFAPFVSRLKVFAENSTVQLTWTDSEDVEGSYEIYRHTEEITENNFNDAVRVGKVEDDAESFVDSPDEKGTYYYAVLAKQQNKLYKLFIPFRNKTVNGVEVQKTANLKDIAVKVTDIATKIREDSVLINFSTDKPDRELIIYRHTEPLKDRINLIKATPLRVIQSSVTSYRDFPVPGLSYYYGVFDGDLVKADKIDFRLGENTTTIPARVPLGTRIGLPDTTLRRSLPLPLYPLPMEVDTGKKLRRLNIFIAEKTEDLNPATSKAVTATLRKITLSPPKEPEPVVLEEDTVAVKSGGEEYTLKSIIDSYFTKKKWPECKKELKDFLSVHHSELLEKRAHFYLGQVYYFLEEYRQSFMELLLAKKDFYTKVDPWLDAIFKKLRESP